MMTFQRYCETASLCETGIKDERTRQMLLDLCQRYNERNAAKDDAKTSQKPARSRASG